MEILRLLDELEEMADSGERWYCRFPPFIGKTVLDAADLFDLIHQMRNSLPPEMTEATQLARDRDRILEEAHGQRAKIIEAAREQAQLMTSNDELVKQAESKADAIIEEAAIEGDHIRSEAEAWPAASWSGSRTTRIASRPRFRRPRRCFSLSNPGARARSPGRPRSSPAGSSSPGCAPAPVAPAARAWSVRPLHPHRGNL